MFHGDSQDTVYKLSYLLIYILIGTRGASVCGEQSLPRLF